MKKIILNLSLLCIFNSVYSQMHFIMAYDNSFSRIMEGSIIIGEISYPIDEDGVFSLNLPIGSYRAKLSANNVVTHNFNLEIENSFDFLTIIKNVQRSEESEPVITKKTRVITDEETEDVIDETLEYYERLSRIRELLINAELIGVAFCEEDTATNWTNWKKTYVECNYHIEDTAFHDQYNLFVEIRDTSDVIVMPSMDQSIEPLLLLNKTNTHNDNSESTCIHSIKHYKSNTEYEKDKHLGQKVFLILLYVELEGEKHKIREEQILFKSEILHDEIEE